MSNWRDYEIDVEHVMVGAFDTEISTNETWVDQNALDVDDDTLGAFGDDSVDVFGEARAAGVSRAKMGKVLRKVLAKVQALPLRHARVVREGDNEGPYHMIGADRGAGGVFNAVKVALDGVKRRALRVHTEASHAAEVAARATPYEEALAARVARLEQLFAEHVADGHGGALMSDGEKSEAESLAAEIAVLGEAARAGGYPIPLSLPPEARGCVECVRDGDEIHCSIRIPAPDGTVRVATSTTPVDDVVEEVSGLIDDADTVEVLGALPEFAQVLGCVGLVSELCGAAAEILGCLEYGQTAPLLGTLVCG